MSKKPIITEQYAVRLFTELFGRDLVSRIDKLCEEWAELEHELFDYVLRDKNLSQKEKVLDELSDLYTVLVHLASILGSNSQKLLEMAVDKVERRQIDPNYKR